MDQEHFLNYLTAKATSVGIPHDPANKKIAIHILDDPYDLGEFDKALRNFAAFPAMLLEEGEGEWDDNNSVNYTDNMAFSFMIVDRVLGEEKPRQVRSRCKTLALNMLTSIRKDVRTKAIVPGIHVNMRLDGVPYYPIGPMDGKYYGYMVTLRFVCPFSF